MPKGCVPCMAPDVKDAIRQSVRDPWIAEFLDKLPDCPGPPPIQMCGKKGRARGPRQEFMSTCLKSKHIKSFAEAPKAMKECSVAWRAKQG